jgi:hypothetical protein
MGKLYRKLIAPVLGVGLAVLVGCAGKPNVQVASATGKTETNGKREYHNLSGCWVDEGSNIGRLKIKQEGNYIKAFDMAPLAGPIYFSSPGYPLLFEGEIISAKKLNGMVHTNRSDGEITSSDISSDGNRISFTFKPSGGGGISMEQVELRRCG